MRRETSSTHQSLVASAIELIHSDLDSDLTFRRLAEDAGVSPFHFHRLFCAVVGEPPATYVRRLRLERAALGLKHGRRPVTDIALQAGYETHEAFTRAFKSRFGVAPLHFRAETRAIEARCSLDVEPVIVRLQPRRIAYVRHVGPYDATTAAFAKVVTWAGRRGLLPGANLIGVYWDDQTITPPDRTRCEIGLYVDEYAVGDREVGVRQLPGGDYAVLRYRGPSVDRRRTYDRIYARWLPERGREAAPAPPFEVYSSFGGDFEAIDWITSVHVPLVPKTVA